MSFETGWCDDCCCPIGLGPCAGCGAYAAVVAQSDDPDDWEDGTNDDEWDD